VKCAQGHELLVDLILVAFTLHVSLIASIVVFRCVSMVLNPVLMVNRFSIAMRYWPS
jgi:hypothetical protein